MIEKKELAKNTILNLIAYALERGSLLITLTILSNYLHTKEFANYAYFQITVAMLASYASMGIGIAASKLFAEYETIANETLPPLGTLWAVSIITGMIISTLIFLSPKSLITTHLEIPQWAISLGILSLAIGITPNGALVGLEKFKELTYGTILFAIILVASCVFAGLTGSVLSAMVGFIIATTIKNIYNSFIIIKSIKWKNIVKTTIIKNSIITDLLKFIGPMFIVSLLSSSGNWFVGRIILNHDNGEQIFSQYSIALQWLSMVLFLPGVFTKIFFPKIIKNNKKIDKQYRSTALLKKGTVISLCSAIAIALTGIMLSPLIEKLYKESYNINKIMIGCFLVAAIPMAPANMLGNGIIANNLQKAWLAITVLWFAAYITLSKLFVNFDITGIATSYGISAALLSLIALIYSYKKQILS